MNEKNDEIKPERLVNKQESTGSYYRIFIIAALILGSIFYYYSTRDDLKKEANKILQENSSQNASVKGPEIANSKNSGTPDININLYADLYKAYSIAPLPSSIFKIGDVKEQFDILNKEKCDKKAIFQISHKLADNNFKREAITLLNGYASKCPDAAGDILYAANLAYSLAEYKEALDLTSKAIHEAPHSDLAIYLQAKTYKQMGRNSDALLAYADVIKASLDKRLLRPEVFTDYALSYAAIEKYCEAASVLQTYVSFDYEGRKNNTYTKEIEDYEKKGLCGSGYAKGDTENLIMNDGVFVAKVKINGIDGNFIVDTGATLVSVTPEFSKKAHLAPFTTEKILTQTANGEAEAELTTIDNVKLGSLSANKVSGVIMGQHLGPKIDGLLGLSFLSRFHFAINEKKLTITTSNILPKDNTEQLKSSNLEPRNDEAAEAFPATSNTDIVSQIANAVKLSSSELSSELLAKIARICGQRLYQLSNSHTDGDQYISKFVNDCYEKAKKSGQRKNIMACFIADYEAADLSQRHINTLSLKETLTSVAKKKLAKVLNSIGINDEVVVDNIQTEFLSNLLNANFWTAKLTEKQLAKCYEDGVGSSDCN